jgi:hypothetical protein
MSQSTVFTNNRTQNVTNNLREFIHVDGLISENWL